MNFLKETFVRTKPAPGHQEYIDLAKGICIILVVLYHYYGSDVPVLRQIRMPLYFVLSGLFYHDYGSFLRLIAKRIDRNIIPIFFYVAVGGVTFLILTLYASYSLKALAENTTALQYLISLNAPMWFLLALFWANLMFFVVKRVVRREPWIFLACITIGVAGYFIPDRLGRWLFGLAAMRAMPFFYMGYALQRTYLLGAGTRPRYAVVLGVILLGLCTVIALMLGNPYLSYFEGFYDGNPLLYYTAAAAGVAGLLMLCKEVKWLPFISYCGRFSIIILGMHSPLRRLLFSCYDDDQYHAFPAIVKLLIVIGYLLALWLCIPLLRTLAPHLTAQKEVVGKFFKK